MRQRKGCPVPPDTPSAVSGAAGRLPLPQRQVRSASEEQRLFRCGKPHMGGFRYELRLLHEVAASDKLPGKREDVAALAQTEVVPELFRHVHTERGRALTSVRGKIPQLVTASSDRLMSQPCEKIRKGIFLMASISVRSMPVSVDDELDADPELRVETSSCRHPTGNAPGGWRAGRYGLPRKTPHRASAHRRR